MTMATPPFGQIFGVHVRTVPGNTCAKMKSVALIVFELLTFNAEKFRRSRDSGHAPFGIFFEVMSGLSLETLLSNFKSVALTVFELLAFNAQKFRGSRHATPLLEKIWESCPDCPWEQVCQISSP